MTSLGFTARRAAVLAVLAACSCRMPEGPARDPPPSSPARSAPAPSAGPARRATSFAALGQVAAPAPAPAERAAVRFVDLSGSPGSPLLDAAAEAVRKSDWSAAKQRLATAIAKLDPVADFDSWLAAHVLWGRACDASGDRACAEREYEAARSSWKDAEAAARKARGDGDQAAQHARLGRAVVAVAEAHFFFAEKHRKENVEPLTMPEYKGSGTQKDVGDFNVSDVAPWMKKKIQAIGVAEREYLKVTQIEPGPAARWLIEAAAAVGKMWDAFVRELLQAPSPNDFKKPSYAKVKADYLRLLEIAGLPSKQRARNAFTICRDHAEKNPGHDEIARPCTEWLDRNPAPESEPETTP